MLSSRVTAARVVAGIVSMEVMSCAGSAVMRLCMKQGVSHRVLIGARLWMPPAAPRGHVCERDHFQGMPDLGVGMEAYFKVHSFAGDTWTRNVQYEAVVTPTLVESQMLVANGNVARTHLQKG